MSFNWDGCRELKRKLLPHWQESRWSNFIFLTFFLILLENWGCRANEYSKIWTVRGTCRDKKIQTILAKAEDTEHPRK